MAKKTAPPKKSSAVLRPSGSAATLLQTAPKVTDVYLRPADAGGEINLAGADVLEQAGIYADLEQSIEDAEAALKKLKDNQGKIEEWLLEQMTIAKTQRLTAKGRTIYVRTDFIVSKGKGITTDQVNEQLRDVGLGDLIAEGYNANTLKATVKEMEERARAHDHFVDLEWLATLPEEDQTEAGAKRFAYRCSKCGEFFAEGGQSSVVCTSDHEPVDCHRVENGVPILLRGLLYIAVKPKLGCTKG